MAQHDTYLVYGPAIPKALTGIQGLDEITNGGLPRGRPTIVAGSAGCGKTVLGMEVLVHGAREHGENGVFVSFEESVPAIFENMGSFGWDVEGLVEDGQLLVESFRVSPEMVPETGEFNLEGLFVRLEALLRKADARRLTLDTLEALFSYFQNQAIIRAELQRLFQWLRDQGITTVITAEAGQDTFTRQGLEEYVSDCVLSLDHRIINQISTRRLRIVKYRGSTHGSNEYPFMIGPRGFILLPITSMGLSYDVPRDFEPWGVSELDEMLGGNGLLRASSVLLTGTPGTGKTTLAGQFAAEGCRLGERVLYFGFEESPDQILRNLDSIGLDMRPYLEADLLQYHCLRPTAFELEAHLFHFFERIEAFQPARVVLDPVSNLVTQGTPDTVKSLMMRLLDTLKAQRITSLFTHLMTGDTSTEATDVGISSLMDTWVVLNNLQAGRIHQRYLYILKARGLGHSRETCVLEITGDGVHLRSME